MCIIMKQWIEKFKLALIEENIDRLEQLLNELNLKENTIKISNEIKNDEVLKEELSKNLSQIQALLQEALELIHTQKDSKAIEIQKIQKALKYFKS